MKTSKELEQVKNQCVRAIKYYHAQIVSVDGLLALDKAIAHFKEKECKADKFFKTITSYKQHESEEK